VASIRSLSIGRRAFAIQTDASAEQVLRKPTERERRHCERYEKASRTKPPSGKFKLCLIGCTKNYQAKVRPVQPVREHVAVWIEAKKLEIAQHFVFYRNSLAKFLNFLARRADRPMIDLAKMILPIAKPVRRYLDALPEQKT
jgi:hypothetical protein